MIADRTRRAIPVAIVLVIAAAGLVLFALSHWRRGAALLGAAALVGAGLRMCIRGPGIGVLAVRSRTFDVLFFLLIGVGFELLVFWQ